MSWSEESTDGTKTGSFRRIIDHPRYNNKCGIDSGTVQKLKYCFFTRRICYALCNHLLDFFLTCEKMVSRVVDGTKMSMVGEVANVKDLTRTGLNVMAVNLVIVHTASVRVPR